MLTTVTVLLNRLLIPTAIAVASLAACASAANYESLPPIADNARELRIRTDYFAPLFPGAATAYVVTSGQVIVHSYDGLRWTSHEIRTPVADEILTMAADLRDLDGRRIVCTFDAERTQVEGAIDGARFVFVIEAADGCSTGDGRRINDLVHLVMRAATP